MNSTSASLTSNNPNEKVIHSAFHKLINSKDKGIDNVVLQQLYGYSNSPNDSNTLFCIFLDATMKHSNHPLPLYKSLYVMQDILKKNPQHMQVIARSHLLEMETISLLSFETKNNALRPQIHEIADSLYSFIAFSNRIQSTQGGIMMNNGTTENYASIPSIEWVEDVIPAPTKTTSHEQFEFESEGTPDEQIVDPFDDFVAYDPFLTMTVPETFSLELYGREPLVSHNDDFSLFGL